MKLGTSFLKSKIARRFCLLFIFCAFVPTVALVVISYNKVVSQLEQQSLIRLKREAKSYGLSLFDRMTRISNELQAIGRDIEFNKEDASVITDFYGRDLEPLFLGISLYNMSNTMTPIYGVMKGESIVGLLTGDVLSREKPFVLSLSRPGDTARIIFGVNVLKDGKSSFSIVGEVRPDYLWGVGPEPILPPMTGLSVRNANGDSIIASGENPAINDQKNADKYASKEPGVYQFVKNGRVFFSSPSNLFVASRFQPTGWTIEIIQAREDAMSSLDSFKQSFPFIILLFLLLILYLSVFFIRKGLEPLEKLKEGTKRIASKDFSTKVDISSDDEFEELGKSFNEMAGKLDNQFHAMTVLGEIERAILSSFDRTKILGITLRSFREFFRCDIVLLVKNSESSMDHVKVYVMQGRRNDDPRIEYCMLDEAEQGKIFVDCEHIILSDQLSQPTFPAKISGESFADFLCLPLLIEGKVNRVLMLGWKATHECNEDQIKQARQIANQLAIALTNSKLLENMEKLAMGTVEALARTVDAKSKWTAGHSERVAVLAGRIARAMGNSEREIDIITRAGLLHDIGKIGIPLAILDKPDILSDHEYAEIRNHPVIGGKILEPIKAYQDILPMVIHHHERYDGSGYPEGLKGEEIDIRARILAVADVWDALVSDRPYREGWIKDKAKKLIVKKAGSHFDPQVVEIFLAVIAEEI